ncbi:MAG: hypothetical protein HeimC3_14970 [Candidatus Heimdallarchaeota archaeon LC_3]|nr:MAG: hypothetical protein HeimC3_14970 [Candidatus Heimdallarchaeota archaeon LC_3]
MVKITKKKFIEKSLKFLKEKNPDLSDVFDAVLITKTILDKRFDPITKAQLETLINCVDSL